MDQASEQECSRQNTEPHSPSERRNAGAQRAERVTKCQLNRAGIKLGERKLNAEIAVLTRERLAT
jgi:hypothetical protein